jgi:CO/xanthine dehydrogenase Mo-binding subunit
MSRLLPAAEKGQDGLGAEVGHCCQELGRVKSRQAVTAGNAVYRAEMVADKIRQTAAALLEASAEDMELVAGTVRIKGVPAMSRSIAEIRGPHARLVICAAASLKVPGDAIFYPVDCRTRITRCHGPPA